MVKVYPLEHDMQSPSTAQFVHPVLLPFGPQQLPPRQTPLEQELPEEHLPPSNVLLDDALLPAFALLLG